VPHPHAPMIQADAAEHRKQKKKERERERNEMKRDKREERDRFASGRNKNLTWPHDETTERKLVHRTSLT
jgi:hypothetical protein